MCREYVWNGCPYAQLSPDGKGFSCEPKLSRTLLRDDMLQSDDPALEFIVTTCWRDGMMLTVMERLGVPVLLS